ncbi:hypothetical protein FB45DRAFT_1017907 [Roridomyces roridus]|uniref:Uncharacterized protein n=1 Tax=Roridomyces roridus TaxID=1738132 RepID=A0AAD7CJL9_9AGAR|nr:hypothetical protein FB45DRAFT_1017907 [Roridomyces roridus]
MKGVGYDDANTEKTIGDVAAKHQDKETEGDDAGFLRFRRSHCLPRIRLTGALFAENTRRIEDEDLGLPVDGEDVQLEPLAPTPSATPAHVAPHASSSLAPPLSRKEKKKAKKRVHDRNKRKAAAREAEDGPQTPTPSPRILKKAAASSAVNVDYSASDFRASEPRWTGAPRPLEHPLLKHARDTEFLKKHMRFVDWQGEKTHVLIDRTGYIIGVLVAPPLPGEKWKTVHEKAAAKLREAREKMTFPGGAYEHRRSFDDDEGFPTHTDGYAFGGGMASVSNVKPSSAHNTQVMDEVRADPSVARMATYPIPPFQALCHPIYSAYRENKHCLLREHPGLRHLFPRSPFAALTFNLGPFSVSPPHADRGNKADGMCLIGALGNFDADKGGHIVLTTSSFDSRRVGEERFSMIQYSAGGLFRWAANGFKSDLAWAAAATKEDVAQREEARQARWATALQNFTRWKDAKVGNYTGRARVEVWAEADAGDISDLTDIESEAEEGAAEDEEEEPFPKKIRLA